MNGVRDGVVGFFLFFAHWLSPETGKADIDIDFNNYISTESIVYKCKLDIAWNNQLEQLVDAGIPLCYKISYYTDKSDTVSFYRSLHFNMVNYSYKFTDSTEQSVRKSKSYSLIDLALRDFCRWEILIPYNSSACRVDVSILPSKAAQLNKVVDMSRVWGQQKVTTAFDPNNNKHRSKRKE